MTERDPNNGTDLAVGFSESDDEILAFNREAAQEQRAALVQVRSMYQQEAASIGRWLTASLLAINSGAIIATLNAEGLSSDGKIVGGALFAGGVLAALLVAYSNLKIAHRAAREFPKHLGYWIAVHQSGEHDEHTEESLDKDWKKVSRLNFLPDFIGWVSLALFVSGLISIGLDLRGQEAMNQEEGNTSIDVDGS